MGRLDIFALLFVILLSLPGNSAKFFNRRLQNDEDGEDDDNQLVRVLVTFRDFLPASCAFEVSEQDISDELKDLASALSDQQKEDLGEFDDPLNRNPQRNCGDLARNSAWQVFIAEGAARGHPDMNILSQVDTGGSLLCRNEDIFPIASCRNSARVDIEDNEMVLENLEENTGGIPKPVYCRPNPDDRCGFQNNGNRHSSRKKFFDIWWNDDLSFNKRVGQALILNANGNGNEVAFDSLFDDDAPEDGGDNDIGFFGPLKRFKDELGLLDFDNPEDFPAWPATFNGDRGFFMTTEVHLTFEFFELQDMTFTFSGDDDFWAFINGQLVIDLQGNHGRLEEAVDLNDFVDGILVSERLGLVDGEVYTLDIFHAERNVVQSNFEMSTTLNAACNVIQAGSVAVNFTEGIASEDFDELFVTESVERINENSFALASENGFFSANFIFTNIAENVGRGFIATFDVVVDQATEGFAFVVQNRGNENYPLSFGSTFNFFGVTNSFAVVFDYCTNRDDPNFDGNCDGQDVRVHHADSAEEPNNAGDETKRVFDNIIRSNGRKFNEQFKVEIIFFGERPNFLEVYIDNSLFLREKDFDIEGILGNLGAFVGFTASTGAEASNITISNFVLQTVEVDASNSAVVSDDEDIEIDSENSTRTGPSREILGDGLDVGKGITFQTFDFCENIINTGTLAEFADGLFIEELNETTGLFHNGSLVPNIETAIVLDNNDGSYTTTFTTEIAGSYEAFVAFGEECALEVNIVGDNEDEGTPGEAVVSVVGAGCFFADEPEAANVIEFIEDESSEATPFEEEEDELSPALLGAGGGFLILILVGALLFAYHRAKWRRNARFVKPGHDYLLELNTNVTGGEEYQSTGLAVLQTQKEILNLKAQGAYNPREQEINSLSSENAELKAIIGDAKKNQTGAANVGRDSVVPQQSRNARKRVEF